ncbi:MAG: pentapeptide repeat-containing protein [Gemmatimonadetes bacterium]|nr:pentapeptide repeat-containing protein [Gemmatimonadota bacterium]
MPTIRHRTTSEILLRARTPALAGADLAGRRLAYAALAGADLEGADLTGANLAGASLRDAQLHRAELDEARLDGADLAGATLFRTIPTGLQDLHRARGLDAVVHHGTSALDAATLRAGIRALPVAFLRGAGLSNAEIEALRRLYDGGGRGP